MKTKDLCMLFAGLFLVGCSADEEIATISNSESNAISFNVVSNNPQTKAMIINSTNDLQQQPFKVYAFRNGAAYGDDGGIEIEYKNPKWDYKDHSKLLYWPHDDEVDFYAVSPSNVSPSCSEVSMDYDNQSFSCVINDDYGARYCQYLDYNVVLYAMAKDRNKTSNNGGVQLRFKHALSQVVFKAKKNDPDMQIVVNNMVLHYVQSSGTFQFPSDETAVGEWTHASDVRLHTKYTIGFSQTAPLIITHASMDISEKKPLLFIPQKLTAWNPKTEQISSTLESSYLEIQCTISKKTGENEHYFVPKDGNGTSFGTIYVPFSADWKEGKRYIYTLVFGAGYDENGNEYDIVPITFEANVANWDDEYREITDSDPTSL